jgi:hypothetical protein
MLRGEGWIQHRFNTFHGTLELDGDRLRYAVDSEIKFGDKVSEKGAKWLVEQTGDPTAGERLGRGDPVQLFDVSRHEAQITWPRMGLGVYVRVQQGDRRWDVRFVSYIAGGPGVIALLAFIRIAEGRRASKPFRDALK